MSFNVLNAWNDISVGNRDNMAADEILEFLPDVVGLQEFDTNYRLAVGTESLIELISDNYSEIGSEENSWNPLFYNTDTVLPLCYGFETYTDGTEYIMHGTVMSEFRTYTWAVFEQIESGKQFAVFNTHLDTDPSKRPLQCAEITSKVTEVMEQYGISNVFLMGDLNSTVSSATAQELFDFGFTDSRSVAITRDNYGSHGALGTEITSIYAAKGIDHIYYIGAGTDVIEYKTITDIRNASDHCPIFVNLKIK